ncbi:hypothetical protein Z959_05380 [Clostridium novyi B str. ATCC 27606]|uniref:Peptidase S1 domain-containing protein n=2 Tax=Clostridium TaxID=1485 RepID=A0AA40ISC8_CLONO|nr:MULTISPECIES: hypothetical protein [Clostridium]KEI12042.1 hypothetical protein Z959_05380 [Clostridium novyi B str. ATCC 27606]KEI13870.1 hypothetical protein Z958_01220 [Clostridium novyi B str. NCTC 9691]KEI18065.1 hypothetical protein Z960_04435 [Clostridium haemolyticum NCTC 9693]KGN02768.1 hypothetical protein Z961_07980 [Clostridium haemolyticum NCTC 8350]CAG7840453.1 hypothetical protein CLOHAE12215_01877 [Clostridium haemolyticum]
MVKGFYTNKKCIAVFVTKKVSRSELLSNEVIPNFYKGIETDVNQCEMPVYNSLTSKIRPVVNGYSVGNILSNISGTAGCLVADRYVYILSSNHILALNNQAPIGSIILQPGTQDGGKAGEDIIGHLDRFIPIAFVERGKQPENVVDCALCKITRKSLALPIIAFVGNPKGVALPILNENVKKIGRTTEKTTGKVKYLFGTFEVDCLYVSKIAIFKNQIATTKMAEPGDSGALLLNSKDYALGLLLGSSNNIVLFNPIQQVLDRLNVKLVTS